MARRRLAALNTAFRRASSRSRVLPSFLVLGAQKAGTTSFFELLKQHPSIRAPRLKEVNFFDKDWSKGLDHYRSVFPRESEMRNGSGSTVITFDNTPSYLYHPRVPRRVKQTLPDARLVVLLRDPTDRAYSHYLHATALGRETLSFQDALAAEGTAERSDGRTPVELWAPTQNLAYVARGRYIDHLERWWAEFPREQMLLLKSEELFADPVGEMRKVTDFLDIEPFVPTDIAPRNQSRGPELSPALRAELDAQFEADNRRLLEATGIDFT